MLGTQDKQFTRLLESIEREINNGIINEKVIVQAGHTKFNSKKMKIFDFESKQNLNRYINKADMIITHAGEGSIMESLSANKPTIVAARLKKYREHVNDHQIQIANKMSKNGYVIWCDDLDKLGNYVKKARNFIPKMFCSNNECFCNFIIEEIESYL